MCNIEETTVRDEAVASLNLIGRSMESEQVKAEFLPIVLVLSRHMEWFTPRVSACGLFPLAMQKLSGDAAASKELREGFKQLGIDETPMVRRAAALQLSDFAKALGEALTTEDLLPLYRTLLSDEQDSVRVNALKSTPAVCKLIGSLRKEVLKDNFKKCVGDKSWRVRVACAECIAEVGEGCGGDAEALAEVKDIYCMLQRDHEAEVRSGVRKCPRSQRAASKLVSRATAHAAGGALPSHEPQCALRMRRCASPPRYAYLPLATYY